MMAQPFTGELFHAIDGKAVYEGPGGTRPLSTRKVVSLADATLCTTTPALFMDARRSAYDRLEKAVRLPRYGTDCYAYAMLAAGHVDLVVEVGLQSYDIVALVPIVEAAGGMITDWHGGPAEAGGEIVAAATPELHAAAMHILHRKRRRRSPAERQPASRLSVPGTKASKAASSCSRKMSASCSNSWRAPMMLRIEPPRSLRA